MDANLKSPPGNPIAELIRSELTGYQSLLELLAEERQLLVNREFDDFIVLLGNKHDMLQHLEQNGEQRAEILKQNELSVDKEGLSELFARLPADQEEIIRQDWAQLNGLIDKCAEQNEVNARIAHRAQATTHQILNILRGDPENLSLYGKAGKRDERGKPLPITKV